MIERLIKILRHAGFEDVTAEEVAEMILLADHLPLPEIPPAQQVSAADEKTGDSSRSGREPGSEPPAEAPIPAGSAPSRPDEGGLFDQTAREALEGEGQGVDVAPFRVPRANPLPGARKIARALRPLRRRHPSTRRFILDEERTVCRIAD